MDMHHGDHDYKNTSDKLKFLRTVLRTRDEIYADKVRELLKDEDDNVRRLASVAASVIANENDVTALAMYLTTDKDSISRVGYTLALGNIDSNDARSALLLAIEDSDRKVRIMSARQLTEAGDKRAIGALEIMLEGEDWETKFTAAECLVSLGFSNQRVIDVIHALKGEQAVSELMTIRASVMDDLKDLAESGDPEALRLLPEPTVRWYRDLDELEREAIGIFESA